MLPQTFGEVMSLLSLAVAVFVAASAVWLRSKGGSAERQRMSDKLDYLTEVCTDTRNELRELNRKLDEHAARLVKCEEQIASLFKRIERLELAHDAVRAPGGTE